MYSSIFSKYTQELSASTWGWIVFGTFCLGVGLVRRYFGNNVSRPREISETVREINLREKIEEIKE